MNDAESYQSSDVNQSRENKYVMISEETLDFLFGQHSLFILLQHTLFSGI